MGYDQEKEPVKSGIGRSRHRDNSSPQREIRRIPKLSESIEKERREKRKRLRKRRRIIVMIIAECFVLLFLCGYGFFARRWNMIQRVEDWVPEEVENPNFSVDLPQYQKQKGHWGIYIFGVDSRGSNVGKDTNADVNMICDINHDTGEIRLVSVFRDSYLNIDDNGSYNKINRAYFDGGPSNAAKMLNKNLDLNISDFVTFSWKAVADGINLLGGVDMEISRAEFAYINSFITETVNATGVYSQHLKQPGMNHLDGVQAVAYGRLRLMDTDFARTERQRKVIQAAFEKAKKADLNTLNQLTLVLFPQVATSVDMQDIISLLGDVGKYYIGETGGFPFARGDANMGKKGACVIPQTLEGNVKELHQFLYGEDNYTPSDTVIKISAKIASDTGMHNQGVSIGHVSTAGGVMPSSPKGSGAGKGKAKETKKAREEDDDEDEDGGEGSGSRDDEEGRDGEEGQEGSGSRDEGDGEGGEGTSGRGDGDNGNGEENPSSVILPPGTNLPVESGGSGGAGRRPGEDGQGNSPSGRNPSGGTPSGDSPSGRNPSGGSAPQGSSPSGGASPGRNPSGNSPSGSAGSPSGNSPSGSGTNPSGNSPSGSGTNPSGNSPSGSGTNPSGNSPSGSGTNPSGNSPSGSGTNPSGNSPSGSGTNPSGNSPSGSGTNPSGSTPSGSGTNPSGSAPAGSGGNPSGGHPSGSGGSPSGGGPASPVPSAGGASSPNTPSPGQPQGGITTIPAGPGVS